MVTGLAGLTAGALLLLPGLLGLPQEPLASAGVNFPDSLEARATAFVDRAERELEANAIVSTFASWNYESNLTEANQAVSLAAAEKSGMLTKRLGKEAQGFDLSQVQGQDVKRKLKLMANLGTAGLPDEKLKVFNKLVADMTSTYSKAKVRMPGNCQLLKKIILVWNCFCTMAPTLFTLGHGVNLLKGESGFELTKKNKHVYNGLSRTNMSAIVCKRCGAVKISRHYGVAMGLYCVGPSLCHCLDSERCEMKNSCLVMMVMMMIITAKSKATTTQTTKAKNVLLSAHFERFVVSQMPDFYHGPT